MSRACKLNPDMPKACVHLKGPICDIFGEPIAKLKACAAEPNRNVVKYLPPKNEIVKSGRPWNYKNTPEVIL